MQNNPTANEARDFDDWWREHKRLLLVSEPASLDMVRFVVESKSRDAWQAALQSEQVQRLVEAAWHILYGVNPLPENMSSIPNWRVRTLAEALAPFQPKEGA